MSTKRPSVTSISNLIQKYQGSDFDAVKELDSRIAAIEAIVDSIPNLPELLALAPQINEFLANDTFVAAPLLSNEVDFTAEGFPDEDTLGAIIAALCLLVKINEADIAAVDTPLINAATAAGTSYDPLAGGYDAGLTDVKLVLDSLKALFSQHGRLILADDATQTVPFAYVASGIENLPNDGAGAGTDTTHSVPGKTSFYDVLLDQIDLNQFEVGDVLTLRVDLDVTPSATEQEMDLLLSLAEGTVEATTRVISREYFKTITSHNVAAEVTFVVDKNEILLNPAHVQVQSDSNASIVVNSFELFMNTRNN